MPRLVGLLNISVGRCQGRWGDVGDRQTVIRHCGFFNRCSAPIGALLALTTQAPQVCFDALIQFRGLGIRGTGLLQELKFQRR